MKEKYKWNFSYNVNWNHCHASWLSQETPVFHCLLPISSRMSQFSYISPDLWQTPTPFFLFRCNYWHCTACIRPTTLEVYCFHMDNNTATPIFVSWCARDLERTHSGHTSSSSVTERWRKKWRVLRERNTGGKNNSHFLQKVLKDRGMHFVKSAPLIFPSSTAVTRCEEVTE